MKSKELKQPFLEESEEISGRPELEDRFSKLSINEEEESKQFMYKSPENKGEKAWLLSHPETNDESEIDKEVDWRLISVDIKEAFPDCKNGGFSSNKIKTSKYSILTFLPKNLFVQFTKIANVYFLVMTALQMIPSVSITGGQPTILMPLSFVVLVSMVKDVFEDYKRYLSDKQENNRKGSY